MKNSEMNVTIGIKQLDGEYYSMYFYSSSEKENLECEKLIISEGVYPITVSFKTEYKGTVDELINCYTPFIQKNGLKVVPELIEKINLEEFDVPTDLLSSRI